MLVAGLLTKDDTSPTARILDGMVSARFPFVLSQQVLAEYRAALVQPKVQKLHGLTAAETDALLTDIVQHAIVLAPMDKAPAAPDIKGRVLTPARFAALMS
ncbi:MAG: hypothetical protein LXA50_06335 [Betaproteobacteria bacterium]|nr:hypothetical protein [Betaproteobacteria bacterium]